jgi:NAD-dependent DNA ligase
MGLGWSVRPQCHWYTAPCGRERRSGSDLFPNVCPRCGSDIYISQQRWRCIRGRDCHAVGYAVGRDQLDIEGLVETRIMRLITAGLVADFADLFTLTRDQLLTLDSPSSHRSSIGWWQRV